MKSLILLFWISTILSCQPKTFRYEGEILGNDLKQCMCCGGTYIKVDNKTYRFYKLPKSSKIKLRQENFPISVKLNFNKNIEQCLGDEIVVEEIVLDN